MPRLYFNSTRYADLPLHYGRVPTWLAERMTKLGGAILESIVLEYGQSSVLQRLSDPFWFQALGAAMGMDLPASRVTAPVVGALIRPITPRLADLGIYLCGGTGKPSRDSPNELLPLADRTGLDGNELVRSSRLTAK